MKKQKKLKEEKSLEQKKIEADWKNFKRIFWSLFILKVTSTGMLRSGGLSGDMAMIFLFFNLYLLY